jgi:hypothetical protein
METCLALLLVMKRKGEVEGEGQEKRRPQKFGWWRRRREVERREERRGPFALSLARPQTLFSSTL